MKTKLLILRGRPGAGKSSIAKKIQEKLLPNKVSIFSPDYFYWQVFPGENNKDLVNEVLFFCIKKYLEYGYFVILEGILPASENKDLFENINKYCKTRNFGLISLFLEVDKDEAIKRNKKRSKGKEILDQDFEDWYNNSISKEIDGEIVIDTTNKSFGSVVNVIVSYLVL